MIRRIARLTAAEAIKLSSHPFLYAALGLLAVGVVLAGILQPRFSGQKETVWRDYHALQLFAYGFKFGLKLATYVLLIFSSMMFAGEFDRGTIKNLLTRPITRTEFFAAKGVTVACLALLLFGFVLYVSLVYGFARGDLGPVWDDTIYSVRQDPEEILGHARKALLLSLPGFFAAGFMGILVSNWTESSGYAVAIALVLYLFGDLATGMLVEPVQRKFFFHYAPYALEKLKTYAEGTDTSWNPDVDGKRLWLTVPLVYIAAFLPPAYLIFRARNIHA